jgi:hypothetical protein
MGVPIEVPFIEAPFMLLVPVFIELGVCISGMVVGIFKLR